ncbi:hypothetical protein AK830_g3456 [Neonectria ditissima]|uniref:Uncharacterized protein n=1 Tax=Neonectria ditissima TaxID=78410 RepID=A0A0P7BP02_9HYPO|nr:hypothetical protein AK830_g3456 [Neonectria ditissima]
MDRDPFLKPPIPQIILGSSLGSQSSSNPAESESGERPRVQHDPRGGYSQRTTTLRKKLEPNPHYRLKFRLDSVMSTTLVGFQLLGTVQYDTVQAGPAARRPTVQLRAHRGVTLTQVTDLCSAASQQRFTQDSLTRATQIAPASHCARVSNPPPHAVRAMLEALA